MKKFLPALLFIFSFSSSFSQTYGNEWINYDQQYFKFKVTADGIYRLDQTTLDAALSGIGVSLATIDPRNFQLFNKGIEEYIYLEGEGDGVFDAGDFIEFYGRKNDGTFDTQLFDSANMQLHTYESIISDTAYYFLTWNNSITNNRLNNLVNDLSGAPSAELYSIYHTLKVYGATYGSAYFNAGVPHFSVYSSRYSNGEGYTTPKYNVTTFTQTILTPNIYTGAAFTPSLKTVVVGSNDSEHHTVINFNGENLEDSVYWDYQVMRYDFPIDNLLASNTIAFVTGPVTTDYQRYSFTDLMYPRIFDFDNVSKTIFELPDDGEASSYLELTDFNEKSTSPILYDFTGHNRMVAIVESDISKFHLPYSTNLHKFYVGSQDVTDIYSVTVLTPVNFIDYTDPANQGNYLIISHAQLFDDGTGVNWVEEYKNYRASVAGGNFDVIIADIDKLYEQFSYGIKKHPLAIRNFILYAKDSFDLEPEFVFLIGKSYSYDVTRANATPEYGWDLVPTFGHPGADNLLAARPGSIVPEVAIGRIAAENGNEVRIYLEKMIAFEAAQADHVQTVENKAWMKNVLHFAGGTTEYEQTLFHSFLTQYKNTIEDTLYGGNVTPFNKLTADPIFTPISEYYDSILTKGVSLVTFFGHSSTGSFDYNIGEPEEFHNEGKYFVVYGNGCNTASIHGESYTLGQRYIFAENKGAIGFIAASNYSFASSLHVFATMFYRELSSINYHQAIGTILKETCDTLYPTFNIFDQLSIEHTTLQGDPALKLNNHEQPDYAIEEQYVFFEPDIITAGTDSFDLHVVVTNLGMAIDSAYYVEVKRTKANGEVQIISERFPATYFRDTLTFTFETDALGGVGLNEFAIHIDNINEIAEIDELNNILGVSNLIISDDAIPIYPVEFSIMNHIPEYFAASTAYVFAEEKLYMVEADTTMNFNSPLKRSTFITESGGVLKWVEPPMTWIPNTVYYWRISPDTTTGDALLWRSSSFLYLPGDITGWNQSHYFQYLEDDYTNISLQETREFEFVPDVKVYEVSAGIYPATHWTEVTAYLNGELLMVAPCVAAGFVCIVVDANSGDPWTTYEIGTSNLGPYNDTYCTADATEKVIMFNTTTAANREYMYQFMMSTVPDSNYFIAYTNNYAEFNEWLADTLIYGHSLYDAFHTYGAIDIDTLQIFDYDRSYIFSALKGDPATKTEIISDEFGNQIEASFTLEGNWNEGTIITPLIGPAASWDKALWSLYSNDPILSDTNSIDIIGVDYNGVETALATGLQSGDTTINFIDAELYPFVKLKLNTKDDSLRTPAQYNYWRVIYMPVPEAALNPNIHFTFNGDSVDQGELIELEIAVTNVSDYNMDSLLIDFAVRDQNNVLHDIPYARQDSLLTDETMISTLEFNSFDIPSGSNTLIVEVNPDNDQPEQFHFNNLAYLELNNNADIRDPLLDVTFDGVHIFDGDIVSAKPMITISLKDENQYLALSDTSLMNISIKYPDESLHDFYFDGTTTIFYPADTNNLAKNNLARVEMHPVFEQDGIYELQLRGKDVSGNRAGAIDYRITFEVINKAMISNVMNYPNPFTSQTKFVFTLTGSEVPDYFKIQIMTVSGKVIREIMRDELGELHIGNNITDFTWDGTDKYGDQLANGLYLYRVVTKLAGESLEKYDVGTDQYFKSGFGKMYLAR